MKKIIYILAVTTLFSCSDFLDVAPKGVLSEAQVSDASVVDNTVNAAYASLGNDHYDTPFSLWPYGDVRSGDAYKGGRDEGDIQDFYFLETFKNVRTDMGELDGLWFKLYVGISRANSSLRVLNSLNEADFPLKKVRQAEVRFLRAHFYFQLKILFKYIPFIDENVAIADYANVSNRALTNNELWEKIAEDFKFGVDNLPEIQSEIGRANKAAATAYLAKTKLYQAYEQDELNNVTSVNTNKLQQVIDLINTIPATYGLQSDFADIFTPGTSENGKESLFAVQFSDKGDGTMFGRLNFGDVLATPMGIGCCDFHKPSKNLANAFKTDANGLPLFDTYDATPVNPATDKVDPRLNHTIAIPGHPWKYDPTTIYQESWNRTPDVYGVYASLKENVCKTCYTQVGPFYGNTKNRIILRYADVMLWKAEALIEIGGAANLDAARQIINSIRTRAKNSTARLKMGDGSYESNFYIGTYDDPAVWNQDFARKAMRWERRLELAMEGSRFFDLVRWGIADSYMNAYFASEKSKIAYLKNGLFTKNRDEYCPIPDNQMRFSKGVYTQNAGY
jgi:hypothetical protein